ncbi:class I SAM-dependent methyltransferase [Jiella pacifica]|uniref:Methyltransferase domain-containing protein n=1 Tax=Jiella pacifica TaxID=2696469 RepID=A0A6N9SZ50_9HYPH|nr:class I SAM-dependent methyltransferase [Jiella pacifica]NDW04370.1 methyltransferase domain-containing protein [Jiella pacifica]
MKALLKQIVPPAARQRMRRLEQLAKLPLSLGTGRICTCCGLKIRRFLHFYGRADVRCPYCNSLPRHRFQARLLGIGWLGDVAGHSILHFAPEFCLDRLLRRTGPSAYLKADFMVSFIPGICVRPDAILDIRATRLPPESHDLIICNHVLEHVEEDERAIAELHRLLKPEGKALITVPVAAGAERTRDWRSLDPDTPSERILQFGAEDHVRFYGMDIVDRFQAAGFAVDVLRPEDVFSPAEIETWGLAPEEPHFILSKAAHAPRAA